MWIIFQKLPGLVSSGCHNKLPQTGWLKIAEIYSLTIVEARSPKSRYQQGWFLLRALRGESVPCLSLSFWCCQEFLACRHITLGCTSVITGHSPWASAASHGRLSPRCVSVSPLKNTSHTRLRARPTPIWLHLHNYWHPQQPYFQMKSHSRVLRKIWTGECTIQPSTACLSAPPPLAQIHVCPTGNIHSPISTSPKSQPISVSVLESTSHLNQV